MPEEKQIDDRLRFNYGLKLSELSNLQLCILIKHTAEYITMTGHGDIPITCKKEY